MTCQGQTVPHACCISIIINCPSSFSNYPGLDSKLCGHPKKGLSSFETKLQKAGEASWKSVALTQLRKKGIWTKLLAREMEVKEKKKIGSICSATANYLYLDLALNTFYYMLGFIIYMLIFSPFNLKFLEGKDYIFKFCFSSEISAMPWANCLLNKYILIWINFTSTFYKEK